MWRNIWAVECICDRWTWAISCWSLHTDCEIGGSPIGVLQDSSLLKGYVLLLDK